MWYWAIRSIERATSSETSPKTRRSMTIALCAAAIASLSLPWAWNSCARSTRASRSIVSLLRSAAESVAALPSSGRSAGNAVEQINVKHTAHARILAMRMLPALLRVSAAHTQFPSTVKDNQPLTRQLGSISKTPDWKDTPLDRAKDAEASVGPQALL